MKFRKISLKVIPKIVFLLLLLSFIAGCGNAAPQTAAPSPTFTAILPTETKIPPTDTPVPLTETPIPTPTETPPPSLTPTEALSPTPKVPSESFRFMTSDDVELAGTLFGEGDIAVILTHMMLSSRTGWFSYARHLARQGFAAFAFDFRGWGASGGVLARQGEPLDILAAVEFLQERGYDRFICMGASMGGTTCLKTAMENPGLFEGLGILAAPFPMGDTANLTNPKLFIFTEQDYDEGKAVFELVYQTLPDPKDMVILPGQAHGTEIFTTNEADQLTEILTDFVLGLR